MTRTPPSQHEQLFGTPPTPDQLQSEFVAAVDRLVTTIGHATKAHVETMERLRLTILYTSNPSACQLPKPISQPSEF